MDPRKQAAEHWDKMARSDLSSAWTTNNYIRSEVMRRITGDKHKFWLNWLIDEKINKSLGAVLSVGCGTGGHEFILAKSRNVDRIDAFDVSPTSIDNAIEAQKKEDPEGKIRFYVQDFEGFAKSGAENEYDTITFFGSLHHVTNIEEMLVAVHKALKFDGRLLFNEFIGPTYNLAETHRIKAINDILSVLPQAFKSAACPVFKNPLYSDIQAYDPSECVRSSLITPLLKLFFEIEFEQRFGGVILHNLYPCLNHSVFNADTEYGAALSGLLCVFEKLLIEHSEKFTDDFSVGIARPRAHV